MATRKTAVTPSSASTSTTTATAYVLRIELRDLKPAIWREVWVAPDITLRQLHAVVQAAMGWEDAHLYGFAVPGAGRTPRYWSVAPSQRFEPPAAQDGMGLGDDANDDARAKLSQLLRAPKDKLLYLYDYGDDWEHLITLKKIITTAEPLPLLAAAAFTGPPEDCGGVPGFFNLVEVLHDPNDPEHADLRAWVDQMKGPGWLPGDLDAQALAQLTSAVARLRPRARRAAKG